MDTLPNVYMYMLVLKIDTTLKIAFSSLGLQLRLKQPGNMIKE